MSAGVKDLEIEFACLGALDEMHAILRVHGISIDEVLAKKITTRSDEGALFAGTKTVVNTRAELMCLLRRRGLSYSEIGRIFHRHHGTVMYTIKRYKRSEQSLFSATSTNAQANPESIDQRVLRLERQVLKLQRLVAVLTLRDSAACPA